MALLLCISLLGLTLASVSTLPYDDAQPQLLQRKTEEICVDNPTCPTLPDICNSSDQALAKTLCPVKCGRCPSSDSYPGCQDSPRINCTDLIHQICSFKSAVHLCPRTCNLCDLNPIYHPCKDHVLGVDCADLPNACNDSVGLISCPLFCGICSITEAATTVTIPTSGPCDVNPCINGGSCFANGFMFTCSCPYGYSGPFCNIEPPPTTTKSSKTTTTATTATTVLTDTIAPTATTTATTTLRHTTLGPLQHQDCYVVGKEYLYQGHRDVTHSGKHCQVWSAHHRHWGNAANQFIDGNTGYHSNFCRETIDADGVHLDGKYDRPFCYVSEDRNGWEYCDLPKCLDCYVEGEEHLYLGHTDKSESGKDCQVWSAHHRHWGNGPDDFSDGLTGYNSNYCRETLDDEVDDDQFGEHNPPFCYISTEHWEYCSIPKCH